MLIIEVLSPGTEAYDRGRKFLHYQESASIQEYALINWQRQLVEIYQRQNSKWTYQHFEPHENVEFASVQLTIPMDMIYANSSVPSKETPDLT